jgi:hypothetical protein
MLSNPESRIPPRAIWTLGGIALFSVGMYLLFSGGNSHIGFPLDDAWIHQTYARNLAFLGEWSFLPGHPSGGSTAPLWSALLAIGYKLGLAPYIWAYLLGTLVLWGLAVVCESAMRQLVASYRPSIPWIGTVLALEWHLIWAAASGMETLLFAFVATVVLILVITASQNYSILGLLIGLSIWVRPDGVTLLGPVLMMILLMKSSWSKRLRALAGLGIGVGILFAFYLLFNLIVSGSPWPNTFYAKQAEYAEYLKLPFLFRWGSEFSPVLTGVGILLLPGVLLTLVSAFQRRAWGIIASVFWFIGFLGLYAWRLPVTYQYGRYIMPTMPIYFLLGMVGMLEFILKPGNRRRWTISMFWKLSTACVLVVFWVLGAFRYVQDVEYIESEMVVTAKWVSSHVPPSALVAAHDIGALGYFGGRDLVDLAGLVSPEVIPFLRDEERLAAYLNEIGVTYLVIFPDWYESLAKGMIPLFSSGASSVPGLEKLNMTVYQWQSP